MGEEPFKKSPPVWEKRSKQKGDRKTNDPPVRMASEKNPRRSVFFRQTEMKRTGQLHKRTWGERLLQVSEFVNNCPGKRPERENP